MFIWSARMHLSKKEEVPQGKRMSVCRGIENKNETENEERRGGNKGC